MPAFLLFLALAEVPTPTTVNGQTLGLSAEYATVGPAKVCMREMSIRAEQGETVYLKYAGIHAGTLTLVSGQQSVDFTDGEIFAKPKQRGHLVIGIEGVRVFRTSRDDELAYLVWVPGEGPEEEGNEQPRVWIKGALLTGASGDLKFLSRLKMERSGPKDCDRTYAYGWDVLFGDKPLSKKKDQ